MRILALLLTGCALGSAEDPRPTVDSGACRLALEPTREAWERVMGPLPPQCSTASLLATYAIIETSDMPPECPHGKDERVVGCFFEKPPTIFLLEGISDSEVADFAVHEWTHVVSLCATGSGGSHADPLLFGPGGVMEIAQDNASIGPCL